MLYRFFIISCLCFNYMVAMEEKYIICDVSHQHVPKSATLVVYNGVPTIDTHNVYGKKMQLDDVDANEEQNSKIAKQEGTKKITFDRNGKVKITLVNSNLQ